MDNYQQNNNYFELYQELKKKHSECKKQNYKMKKEIEFLKLKNSYSRDTTFSKDYEQLILSENENNSILKKEEIYKLEIKSLYFELNHFNNKINKLEEVVNQYRNQVTRAENILKIINSNLS